MVEMEKAENLAAMRKEYEALVQVRVAFAFYTRDPIKVALARYLGATSAS
jgi:hypothetical protein